jgi:Ni/Co efflux regulator RcnB
MHRGFQMKKLVSIFALLGASALAMPVAHAQFAHREEMHKEQEKRHEQAEHREHREVRHDDHREFHK